jgi:hypothetical protein
MQNSESVSSELVIVVTKDSNIENILNSIFCIPSSKNSTSTIVNLK